MNTERDNTDPEGSGRENTARAGGATDARSPTQHRHTVAENAAVGGDLDGCPAIELPYVTTGRSDHKWEPAPHGRFWLPADTAGGRGVDPLDDAAAAVAGLDSLDREGHAWPGAAAGPVAGSADAAHDGTDDADGLTAGDAADRP